MRMDLVLEGGGVKGIALVGALSVLEEQGYEVNRVAGTSAGAIVGSLAAAGMSAGRMAEVMAATDFKKFMDPAPGPRLPLVSAGLSLMFDRGLFAGEHFRGWITELLQECGVTTFADLRLADAGDLPPERAYRLVVMAADTTQRRLARFPWDYRARYGLDPDAVPVADAVRASMSIPFFFEPVRLEDARGAQDGAAQESVLVDGGVLSNFPVAVFDRGDGVPPRWPTIGIRLSAPGGARDMMPPITVGPVGLALDLIATMIDHHDNEHVADPAAAGRTIQVDTADVSMINFALSRDDQMRLYEGGRAAAEEFLRSWDFWAYVQDYRTERLRPLRDVPLGDDPGTASDGSAGRS